MADNVSIGTTRSSAIIATDDVGSVQYQVAKLAHGADGAATLVSTSSGLPVQATSGSIASGAIASGALATGAISSGAVASGAYASGSIASGAIASGAVASGAYASGSIASGAYASGSISDGAIVTIGAKSDAKSTATDGTSVSLMQVNKQISASVQSINTVLGTTSVLSSGGSLKVLPHDGTSAAAIKAASTAPVATDAALVVAISPNSVNANGSATSANSAPVVIASDQGWPVGTTGFMKKEDVASAGGDAGIPAMAIQTASPADTAADLDYSMLQMSGGGLWTKLVPQATSAAATFTPAAASHVANDVNGAAAEFASMGLSGSRIMITSATLYIDNSSAEATAWRLHLYNVTPSSAIADDSPWDFADADVTQYLGFIDLPSTATDLGTNQWVEVNGINKQVKLSGTSMFGYLQNLTTLTPGNVSHTVTLHAIQL